MFKKRATFEKGNFKKKKVNLDIFLDLILFDEADINIANLTKVFSK